jgi:hypothetical protein
MKIDMRINIPTFTTSPSSTEMKDLLVCALSGISRGERRGQSFIAGASVVWRIDKEETFGGIPDPEMVA